MSLKIEIDNNFFKSLQKDYKFLRDFTKNKNDKSLWRTRLNFWFNKLGDGQELSKEKLLNFRRLSILLSEVPRNPYSLNIILGPIYEYLRKPGYQKTCLHNFNKLKKSKDLDWKSFSHIGNPIYLRSNGKLFNERFLRHLRTVKLVNRHVPLKENDLVLDIGAGYGQFVSMLLRKTPKIRVVLVDFPEQLFLARYFLKSNYPKLRINSIAEIYDEMFLKNKSIDKFDVLLIPPQFRKILNSFKPKLLTNFSSFGEMPSDTFNEYTDSDLFKNSKYFFTINRIDSFPTYTNKISLIDYFDWKTPPLHLSVSPIWDYYFESFSPFFVNKKAFLSRSFELIIRK